MRATSDMLRVARCAFVVPSYQWWPRWCTTQVPRRKVREILSTPSSFIGQSARVMGWVRTVRLQKEFAFVEINDGSSLHGVQAVISRDLTSEEELRFILYFHIPI